MKYIVEEMKTFEDGRVEKEGSEPLEEMWAERDYHLRLADAAISGLPCDAVTLLDSEGRMIKREKYKAKPAKEDQQDEQTNQND